MKKIFNSKTNIILFIVLSILTIYRVFLASKIPLYAQGGADLDDYLLVKYATKMINFKWLGAFDSLTLVKGASFSLFLAIGYYLNIPYSIFLILCYIAAIIMLVFALKKYMSNKYLLSLLYIILLFSPVMFHIENTQKIYRGGLIVIFVVFVIASIINLYSNRNEKIKKLVVWSIISSLCLSFFWFIKEDSIWIIPFVCGAIVLSIIWLIINRKKVIRIKTRIFLTVLPIVFLIIANIVYCSLNYFIYGEYTVTDRSGTYYKEVLNDLLRIKNKKIDEIWITKDTIYKAMKESPTLAKSKEQIDEMYENSWALVDGEIRGDIIFWTLRDAFDKAGVYKNGGKKANEYYKKIDKELDKAFANKKLKEEDAFYLSKNSKGITKEDLKYFKENVPKEFEILIDYSENEIGVYEANGPIEHIVVMDYVTNSKIIWPNTEMNPEITAIRNEYERYVNQAKNIVKIYQWIGKRYMYISLIGLMYLLIKTIIGLFKKNYDNLSICLITLGLIVSTTVMFIGVSWFVSWFGWTKFKYMYNYSCGIIPLLQIIKFIGVYYICSLVYICFNKVKKVV